MLASLAALQLVLLTQAGDAPAQPPPDTSTPPGQESPQNPPLPTKPRPGRAGTLSPSPPTMIPAPAEPSPPPAAPPSSSTPTRRSKSDATSTPTSTATATRAPGQLSLLSGESLNGGSASLAWAGWSSLGIMYGQGITPTDDLAAVLEFDWAYTEFRLGGLYRRPFGPMGGFDLAGRLGASWYKDAGWPWVHSSNRTDHGLELAPGVSLSSRSPSGILSVIAEVPLTITMKYSGGLLFRPRVSVAYEAPVYEDLTVGARAGIGWRAGAGDAPLQGGRPDLTFVLMAGYQLL